MRRARVTYQGAFHHAVNRGHGGLPIFSDKEDKAVFLQIMDEAARVYRIRIFAYCIMDSHYHLVLQNSSGRMSEFFKKLNGHYGTLYRKQHSGAGYVFQNRYRSRIIQDDSYLIQVIGYVLNNPVRAGLVKDFLDYPWSSAAHYFRRGRNPYLNNEFVESLYGSFTDMLRQVRGVTMENLPSINTRYGEIIGGPGFVLESLERFDRRQPGERVEEYQRIDDHNYDPVEKVFYEFHRKYGIKPSDLDTRGSGGKRLRGILLVYLRERAGLTYREISRIPIFRDLKSSSLGWVYKKAKMGAGT